MLRKSGLPTNVFLQTCSMVFMPGMSGRICLRDLNKVSVKYLPSSLIESDFPKNQLLKICRPQLTNVYPDAAKAVKDKGGPAIAIHRNTPNSCGSVYLV